MTNRLFLFIFLILILVSQILASSMNEVSSSQMNTSDDSIQLIKDKGVTKIFSDYVITHDMVVNGNLKIIGGALIVDGTVNGEIQVLGGDISINDSAIINGTIIAIGGKIQKSPDANIKGEVLELNKDKFSFSRIPEDYSDSGFKNWFDEDDCCSACRVSNPKLPHSQAYSESGWLRYNRAEGFYLQMNLHVENEFVPGNTLYGGVGRAFNRNTYSGVIGFEQRLFNDSFQLYIEKYDRSATNDIWRINDKLNSFSAFFIHEDFLDWYKTDGFETGGSLVLPLKIKLSALYKDELHTSMNTVATWSLFGSNKTFRDGYVIDEGKEISLNYTLSAGSKFQWECTSSLTGFIQYSRTESQNNSDFIFKKQDLIADSYFPITNGLGIHASVMAGTVSGDYYGPQHQYEIGGIGSLRGFEWKLFKGTRFSSGTVEIVFDDLTIFYDRAAIWSDESDGLSTGHWDKLINSYNGESLGVSIGSHKTRVDIIKPLGDIEHNDIQINLLLFLNDGGF